MRNPNTAPVPPVDLAAADQRASRTQWNRVFRDTLLRCPRGQGATWLARRTNQILEADGSKARISKAQVSQWRSPPRPGRLVPRVPSAEVAAALALALSEAGVWTGMERSAVAAEQAILRNPPGRSVAPPGERSAAAKAPAAPALQLLWRRVAETNDKQRLAARNSLLMAHYPYLREEAARFRKQCTAVVDEDDLVSAGVFGLLDAIDHFDVRRGVGFRTFSSLRVRGAMFDELRARDSVPRLARHRSAKVKKIQNSAFLATGRYLAEPELTDGLSEAYDPEAALATVRDSRVSRTIPIERVYRGKRRHLGRTLPADPGSCDPLRIALRWDFRDKLLRGLTRAEQLILVLYYYESLTMAEIARAIGLSESRVSQMHSSLLARLKACTLEDEVPL